MPRISDSPPSSSRRSPLPSARRCTIDPGGPGHEVSRDIASNAGGTHVTQHVSVYPDQLSKFTVRLVDLSCSAPEASGDRHGRKHSVIVQKQSFKGLLDEHQVLRALVSKRVLLDWLEARTMSVRDSDWAIAFRGHGVRRAGRTGACHSLGTSVSGWTAAGESFVLTPGRR